MEWGREGRVVVVRMEVVEYRGKMWIGGEWRVEKEELQWGKTWSKRGRNGTGEGKTAVKRT